jgi:oxalate decarboxylase/phosphoglucose isomerase-like protein (cupin superfamily)
MKDGTVERGSFDLAVFADELAEARGNLAVGTALWFENHRIKVWEVKLRPGERGAFHSHTRNYFWTVVEAGRGLQRFPDGTYTVREYGLGDTSYTEHTPNNPLIHDLENVGDTDLRFVTVEQLE